MIAKLETQKPAEDRNCKSILFVCWGNVCRSPAAEIILKREMKRRGLGNVQIESAGVAADYKTNRPSFGMRWAALCRGFWLSPTPRLFRKMHCSKYDLVIAMDRSVQFSINTIAGQSSTNVKLLSDFLPQDWPLDVPDPMHRSVAKCNQVLDMLDRACQAMSKHFALARIPEESVGISRYESPALTN